MICVHGTVDVVCDDGGNRRTFALDRSNLALLVPPAIWSTLTYSCENSVVAVLCDRPFEKDDYIYDYVEFVAMRKASLQ